jgi:hypothetical protein
MQIAILNPLALRDLQFLDSRRFRLLVFRRLRFAGSAPSIYRRCSDERRLFILLGAALIHRRLCIRRVARIHLCGVRCGLGALLRRDRAGKKQQKQTCKQRFPYRTAPTTGRNSFGRLNALSYQMDCHAANEVNLKTASLKEARKPTVIVGMG